MASAAAKPAAQPATKDLAVPKLGADARSGHFSNREPRNPSPSQGTEHVALRAIEVVSNKDTPRPNARRFAIRIRRSRDALGDMRLKAIARGPISPAQSYQREAGDLSGAGL